MAAPEIICTFEVPGYVQPKQRTFGRSFVTPPQTRAYENTVRKIAHASMRGKTPYNGFVSLFIEIACVIPKSWNSTKKAAALKGRIFPTHCDIDNCVKALSDGMNRVVFIDDRFITSLTACRKFDVADGARITVYSMRTE